MMLFNPSSFLGTIALLAFVICCFWSLALFIFALMATVSACMGNYSLPAVLLYWLMAASSYVMMTLRYDMGAVMLFVWSSPVLTILMYLFERNRKRKLPAPNLESQ